MSVGAVESDRIRIEAVPAARKEILRRHFQDYLREHSVYTGKKPVDGVFEYRWFDLYWQEPHKRWPYWARAGQDVAAVAFVRLDDRDGCHEMADFFVVDRYRRHGLGRRVAVDIILRFKGRWKLNQARNNTGAIAFWRRVIAEIADYDEAPLRLSDGVERVEQRFTV